MRGLPKKLPSADVVYHAALSGPGPFCWCCRSPRELDSTRLEVTKDPGQMAHLVLAQKRSRALDSESNVFDLVEDG